MKSNRNLKLEIESSPQAAFTLIEMLVVIFVVAVGLIGAMSFFNININNQFENKNELIAAGLVEEDVDLVRNIVDYNDLNKDTIASWYNELANSSSGSSNCSYLDISSLSDHKCNSSSFAKKEQVCLDASDNRYYQCQNISSANRIPTDFFRHIEVKLQPETGSNLDAGGGCLSVTATVFWTGKTTQAHDVICKPRQN